MVACFHIGSARSGRVLKRKQKKIRGKEWVGLVWRLEPSSTPLWVGRRDVSSALAMPSDIYVAADLIFKKLAWLHIGVLAMGSSFTVRMVLEEALVRMVLTVLMLPLRGVSRSSSNLSREQLQHHIMCNNKNAFASSVFPQCDFCFVLRASSLFPKYVFRASSSERASAHKAC